MTLTKQQVREVLDVYIRAWENQDPALIVSIFTEGASYHERVMGEPIQGPRRHPRLLADQGRRGAGQHHLRPAKSVPG